MFKFLLIVAALVPAILAQTPVSQCRGLPLPESVDINGCTSSPCDIVNGAPISAVARGIQSPMAATTMYSFIAIRLAGLEIPFPMPPELVNACDAGTAAGTCPVSAGQVFDYTLNHAGQAIALSDVTVTVEVGLRADSQNGPFMACLQFQARIVSP